MNIPSPVDDGSDSGNIDDDNNVVNFTRPAFEYVACKCRETSSEQVSRILG
jgi:hypothetical protein